MNTLRFLRTFVAAARGGSLAAAADKVAVTQAAVSQQIRLLERELNRVLFDRSGRVARLNAAGRALLPLAERMLALHDELRGVQGDPEALVGAFRFGSVVSATAPLVRAVVELRNAHPALDMRIVVDKSLDLATQVETGELDAAVVIRPAERLPTSLTWNPLYVEPFVVLAHGGFDGDALTALRIQPFLRFDRRERTGVLIEQVLRRHRVLARDFLELNSIEALVELVRQRCGSSLLPCLTRAGWHRDPALRVLTLPGKPVARDVGLLHRSGVRGPVVAAIIRHMKTLQDVD